MTHLDKYLTLALSHARALKGELAQVSALCLSISEKVTSCSQEIVWRDAARTATALHTAIDRRMTATGIDVEDISTELGLPWLTECLHKMGTIRGLLLTLNAAAQPNTLSDRMRNLSRSLVQCEGNACGLIEAFGEVKAERVFLASFDAGGGTLAA